VPYELSITQSPAFSDALVLGVGAESLRTYQALTGIELTTALLAGSQSQLTPEAVRSGGCSASS
jgi:hypothetical protein